MSTMVVVVLFTFLFVGLFQPAQTFFTCQISRRICSDITPSQDFSLRMTHNDGDKGFGVGEKAIEFRDLMRSEKNIDVSVPEKNRDSLKRKQKEGVVGDSPTLRPKAILRFVAPTLALWIAPPIMSLVDTSVVGRFCGPTDLAALGPGCTLIDSVGYLFMFIATATTSMVASATVDGNGLESDRIVSEALFLALCSGTLLAGLVFVAGQPLLMQIAGQASSNVVPSALKYSNIRAFGQPFVLMASVARAAALAKKDTRGPLVSVAIAFFLNVVGTLTLVTWANLGITGAAIGTLCADVAATLFLLGRTLNSRRKGLSEEDKYLTSKPRTPLLVVPNLENFRKFLHYAAPIFFTILGKSVVYNGVALSVGRLGPVALAVHQVLLRSFFFWCPVGDSVGMTSQVFLPGILAEEKRTGIPQRGAKRLLFGTGVVAGLFAATMAGLLPSKGAGLFTTDIHVAAALQRMAPILALCVSMHAIALTCEGMLLAQRDLSFLSSSYVITTIATIGLLLSPLSPSTLGGSWGILALFQGVRALQFSLRNLMLSRGKCVKTS